MKLLGYKNNGPTKINLAYVSTDLQIPAGDCDELPYFDASIILFLAGPRDHYQFIP